MARVEQNWPIDAFDGFNIKAHQGKFNIKGIDGDKVKLEGDFAARYSRNLEIAPVGRWLKIYTSWQYGESQFTLQVPKSKMWTIDIFSGKALVKAENLQTDLRLSLGKGEIQVENCRGNFSLTAGNADVTLKNIVKTAVPDIPPIPMGEQRLKWSDGENMEEWGEDYWTQWGAEFGEKFLRRFFGENAGPNTGVNIQTGKGDVQLENFDLQKCSVRTARGDVRFKQGKVENLDAKLISGDIVCDSCLPAGDWNIRTTRGDIRLYLPADTRARLDATTRHGDIQSKTPLVRVTRQGPESWHGNRMVGSIGDTGTGKLPEIKLSTLNGDVEIKTESAKSQYSNTCDKEQTMTTSPTSSPSNIYKTELEILTALSEGKINVDEAELLLLRLKNDS
jgi:DUF4097 and DUF4098 domain-containing protein YvlB